MSGAAALKNHWSAYRPSDGADDIIKICSCRRKYTRSDWQNLPFVGRQFDSVETHELRNCQCGSTMNLVIGEGDRR